MLKLIFCKVYDEDESVEQVRFFIGNEERRSDLGQRRLSARIDHLFEQVKAHYSYIFDPNERLRLDKRVLAYVVGELQRFSLLQTQADVKGAAYEQLVGANLRGDRGEFFTPRNVCDMAVRMVFTTYPRQEWTRLRVLDPACGTGGFLVAVMGLWREQLYEQQLRKWAKDEDRAIRDTKRRLKDVADASLLGIDFNPVLARAAQMNLVMHGDGSTNVFHANSLLPPGEWPTDAPNDVAHHIVPGAFDIILANPPFGSKIPIDDPHILEQFQLATFEMQKGQVRASMPPEQLFIERCLYLLRPGGRMAIVLPDSILSNPGLAFIRRWIVRKARVIASVDLPQVTFEPYAGTQTSILLLQKKAYQEVEIERELGRLRDYTVFMATPQAVGHDRRGEELCLRTPEGKLIEYEERVPAYRRTVDGRQTLELRRQTRKAVHDELPEVARIFALWATEPERMRWLND